MNNPLEVPQLSDNEILWIDMSFYGGAIIGTATLTLAGDVFGRKYTLLALTIPQMVILFKHVCYIEIHCANNKNYLNSLRGC